MEDAIIIIVIVAIGFTIIGFKELKKISTKFLKRKA